MAAMTATLEGATLGNIADGALEGGFQQRLIEIGNLLGEIPEFEADKNGMVTFTVKMEVAVTFDPSRPEMLVTARTGLTQPKRKLRGGTVRRGTDGAWTVWMNEGDQQPLFDTSKVRELRTAQKGEA